MPMPKYRIRYVYEIDGKEIEDVMDIAALTRDAVRDQFFKNMRERNIEPIRGIATEIREEKT